MELVRRNNTQIEIVELWWVGKRQTFGFYNQSRDEFYYPESRISLFVSKFNGKCWGKQKDCVYRIRFISLSQDRIGSDKADRCLIIMEFCNHIECSRNLDQWVHQLWCIRLQREVKEHFLQDTFLYWIKSVNNGD